MARSRRCIGINSKEKRCRNMTKQENRYCYNHQKQSSGITFIQHKPDPNTIIGECPICMIETEERLTKLSCCNERIIKNVKKEKDATDDHEIKAVHFSCLKKMMKPNCPFCNAKLDIFDKNTEKEMNSRREQYIGRFHNVLNTQEIERILSGNDEDIENNTQAAMLAASERRYVAIGPAIFVRYPTENRRRTPSITTQSHRSQANSFTSTVSRASNSRIIIGTRSDVSSNGRQPRREHSDNVPVPDLDVRSLGLSEDDLLYNLVLFPAFHVDE